MFDGNARSLLLGWGSANTHRNMTSTLAYESSFAARAFDRGIFTRTTLYTTDVGLEHNMSVAAPTQHK